MKKKYKFAFFDVADTLLYKPLLFSSIIKKLQKFNIQIDVQFLKQRHKLISEIISFPHKTSQTFYTEFNRELLYTLGIIPTSEMIQEIFNACYYLPWEKFEDTKVLDQLSVPIGLISNWDYTLPNKLKSFFRKDFNIVICSELKGRFKPDLELFKMAVKEADCDVSKILYIGNSIKMDIMPALQVGMDAILIDRDNLYPCFNGKKVKSLYEVIQFIH